MLTAKATFHKLLTASITICLKKLSDLELSLLQTDYFNYILIY